jgi:hypothetical protein
MPHQRKKEKELRPFRIWMTERMRARLQVSTALHAAYTSVTLAQEAIGDGAGAIEGGDMMDAAHVRQLVVKAGFTPQQADDALRAAGPSLQASARRTVWRGTRHLTFSLIPPQSCLSFLCLTLPGPASLLLLLLLLLLPLPPLPLCDM